MFAFTSVVELEATSADRSVLDAVEHAVAHAHLTRDFIPDHVDGVRVDLSFASEQWQRIVIDRGHPGQVHRRHFEACVFTYLASELRTGDIAVRGSQAYANWAEQLLPWSDCEELLDEFCAETGLPNTARAFTEQLRTRLADQAAAVDAKYPENTDLVIDPETGKPSLKRRRASKPAEGALALEEALKERMPERTLLEILARTAYWLEWWRRFGPASGSDPKLAGPLLRYVLTTFTYGANLGPAQAARHIRGVSAHELGVTAARHFTTGKLNLASADVVNAYLLLDLVKAWGDGTSVAADGTQVDTLIDNLLAESHIRYGGYGGIAYHHIADNYIALFSHFIPCGVWEAVYIIEGLLRQQSDAEPDTIHADTQGHYVMWTPGRCAVVTGVAVGKAAGRARSPGAATISSGGRGMMGGVCGRRCVACGCGLGMRLGASVSSWSTSQARRSLWCRPFCGIWPRGAVRRTLLRRTRMTCVTCGCFSLPAVLIGRTSGRRARSSCSRRCGRRRAGGRRNGSA